MILIISLCALLYIIIYHREGLPLLWSTSQHHRQQSTKALQQPTEFMELESNSEPARKWNEKNGTSTNYPNFSKVKMFLLCIGYPRTGSTLIGSLLDAHPHVVIANEYNLVGRWNEIARHNPSRDYIFNELWENSVKMSTDSKKRRAKDNYFYFSYFVPGLWQGKYDDHISVMGDKKCGGTTRGLSVDKMRFTDLLHKIATPIKFIHIVRNPFDTIATMTLRAKAAPLRRQARSSLLHVDAPQLLAQQADIYLQRVDENIMLRKRFGNSVLDVYLSLIHI